jgi:protocatechuate 3,4-dioxygenase beta subunit
MNRKDFIWKSGAAMLALTLPTRNHYAFAEDPQTASACVPTSSDILGPYYRANAPFRSDLTIVGDPGTILNYKGVVTDDSCNPVANAIVDVWQANDAADYDGTSANFNYRGRFQTGSDGAYAFRSIKPGWYLNGSQYRPAHIHFRVTKPGYTELITQLYFQGDPYIANDPWASDPSAQLRIVPVNVVSGEGTATFDIILKSTSTGLNGPQISSPISIHPNPISDRLNITSSSEIRNLEICNVSGQLVSTSYNLKTKELNLNLAYLGTGVYFCRIETEQGIFVHRFLKQ